MRAILFLAPLAAWAADDADAIMAKVAANMELASEARRQYVYQQTIRSRMLRTSGQTAREEKREYNVIPAAAETKKDLSRFEGKYQRGKEMIPYDKPGFRYKGTDLDGDLISGLTEELVNDKKSKDGISHELFPLRTKDLPGYKFTLTETADVKGRSTHKIAFEPKHRQMCVSIGGDDECATKQWKGDIWVDAAELQPVRIRTDLSFKIPWGVKVFLGTNIRQLGFSVSYIRVAEGVWFPASYGTEFRLDLFWGYKRTITMALESNGFKRTDAASKVEYRLEDR